MKINSVQTGVNDRPIEPVIIKSIDIKEIDFSHIQPNTFCYRKKCSVLVL